MRLPENKKMVIGLLIGALAILILLVVVLQRPRSQNTNATGDSKAIETIENQTSPRTTTRSLPPLRVAFNTYQINAAFPSLPSSLPVYTFKSNYSVQEAAAVANSLGLSEQKLSDDKQAVIFTNLDNPERRGMLTFNLNSGAFIFQSFGNHQPQISLPQQSPLLSAQLFIQQLGFDEPSLRCLDTYEKSDAEGRVYVECHRSVENATVIGFPGILNISENTPLASLRVGQSSAEALEDKTIINTSNNTNQKLRSDDSNTITVEIAKNNNRIISVVSNIRKVSDVQTVTSSDLLTPQEALLRFENNSSEVSAALPAGSGSTDMNRFFQSGSVTGKQAQITDYLLVYPEKPTSLTQKTFAPYYLVRGVGTTNEGLPAKFVQLLPATKNNLSFTEAVIPDVAGAYIAQNSFENQKGSQKQGGFNIGGVTIIPTTQPTQPDSSPIIPATPTPVLGKTPEACTAPTGATVYPLTLQIPGVGEMEVLRTSAHMFFFKSASFPIGDMQQIRQQLYTLVEDQYVINISHWLAEDPSFQGLTIASSGNAYDLYTRINQQIQTLRNTPGRTPASLQLYEAPRRVTEAGRLKITADNVAQKLITAQQQGSITSFAQRKNLFPDSTIEGMDFVLTAAGGEENDGRWGTACYISGSTPSIFVYSDKTQPVSITMPQTVTYSFPELDNKNTWNTQTTNVPYFFYEYDNTKVVLTEQKNGWVVSKKDLKAFVSTLSEKLRLTGEEKERLQQEITLALYGKNIKENTLLKISFADQQELNKQLPLMISPQPKHIGRIHLLLKPITHAEKLSPPPLFPVTRDSYTVLELGARVLE